MFLGEPEVGLNAFHCHATAVSILHCFPPGLGSTSVPPSCAANRRAVLKPRLSVLMAEKPRPSSSTITASVLVASPPIDTQILPPRLPSNACSRLLAQARSRCANGAAPVALGLECLVSLAMDLDSARSEFVEIADAVAQGGEKRDERYSLWLIGA
jgi:hypothetical protein